MHKHWLLSIWRQLRWNGILVSGFLAVMGFQSCARTYSLVEFEVLEPATVSFPPDVQQLIVLNRAPFTFDVLEEEDRINLEPEHLLVLDTLVYKSLFRGMVEVMRQSPIQRFHTPIWAAERRKDTARIQDLLLTKREVADFCTKYGGDAIISLESYTMDLEVFQDYYPDEPTMLRTLYYQWTNQINWAIYLPQNPRPFDLYQTVDTVYFSSVRDGVIHFTPPSSEMVREVFHSSGARYGRYLVPVWLRTSRTVFRGREDSLKLAAKFTDMGQWDSAYHIWGALTSSSDSLLLSKVYHNMAVHHELEDKLDSASLFVKKALTYDTAQIIRQYDEELDTRILNRNEIRKQIR